MAVLRVLTLLALLLSVACGVDSTRQKQFKTIHYYQFSLPGLKTTFDQLVTRFEANHPDIRIQVHTLPTNTDDQHQFYLTHLKSGGGGRIDVFALDVIWLAEFSRGNLLVPVTDLYKSKEWSSFFTPILKAATFGDQRYAVPFFIDGGVLYSRRDLLSKYGFTQPPKTWQELAEMADTVLQGERNRHLHGFIWQGRQYEGLICNFTEYLPRGVEWLERHNGALTLNHNAIIPSLRFMRSLLRQKGISPKSVLAMAEEESRQVFQSGRAVFMRNWPYAWRLAQQPGSPVKDKIQISRIPSWDRGEEGGGTLGGFLLGIHKETPHLLAARQWVRFLASEDAQVLIWKKLGLTPARKTVFPRLHEEEGLNPDLLMDIMDNTVPRPVTPLYISVSQSVQASISGALLGIYSIEESLERMDSDLGRLSKILEHEKPI